jgi:hypothetical protein
MTWTMLPQAIFLASSLMSIGVAMSRYGEPKKPDKYDMVDVLISPLIGYALLYYGGFFAAIGFAP